MGKHTRNPGALIALAILLAVATAGIAEAQVDADRVTLLYNEGAFELVSVVPLTTVVPPSDSLPGPVDLVSGFWLELQGANGEVLYRRIVGDPVRWIYEGPEVTEVQVAAAKMRVMRERTRARGDVAVLPAQLDVEVLKVPVQRAEVKGVRADELPGELLSPVRSEAVPTQRVFTVLVPRAATGDELVLFSSPIGVGTQAEGADEVARFGLAPSNP
jgi:hypothetical protein